MPLSEHAPVLEYWRTAVNCNIYDIGAPTFSINSQNTFFGYRCMCQKVQLYSNLATAFGSVCDFMCYADHGQWLSHLMSHVTLLLTIFLTCDRHVCVDDVSHAKDHTRWSGMLQVHSKYTMRKEWQYNGSYAFVPFVWYKTSQRYSRVSLYVEATLKLAIGGNSCGTLGII